VYRPPWGFAPVFLGLRHQADKVAAGQFARMLTRRYGPDWRDSTLIYISSWSYTQTFFVKSLKPKHLVFHLLDDTLAFPEIKNNPRVLANNKLFLQHMMADSHLVAAVSRELADKYAALYRREVHLLKNGVNLEHFQGGSGATPPDLADKKPPILMYTGSINSWVDLPLLSKLAADRPDYSLVLIGHYYAGSADERLWQALLAKANVCWLDSKPYAQLPDYLHQAAALLLPRTADEHSLASDPLKLYEYLSTGKPVISTWLPAIGDFDRFVHVAGREDFADKVDRALAGHNGDLAGQQMAVMKNHSWPARFAELIDKIAL
jgi:glycosyltransferase involved in cell wall biosynthesis